jgi:hypothetical protein
VGNAPASVGLSDLDAMTFDCPKAALNAAAREAAKVPSQGTYQFSFFRINSDSHHASYAIHFKSNYPREADLKYCVGHLLPARLESKNYENFRNIDGQRASACGGEGPRS